MLPSMETCPEESSVTLPAGISYYHIPVADENLPVYAPLNLNEYIGEVGLRPEIQLTILLALALIVAALIVRIKRKKP